MKTCNFLNCNQPHYGRGYCRKHYLQWYNGRKIQDRTWRDPNDYKIEGNIVYIFLYNVKQEKIAETIIDIDDFEKCKNMKWHLDNRGYVRGPIIGPSHVSLAYFLLKKEKTKGMVIDHKDSNPLNNQKNNLQWITQQQNTIKKSFYSKNTSGYRGVCWDKCHNFWVADIRHNGSKIRIGYFHDKIKAAEAYNKKAKELFKEFAVLNNI